MELFTTAELRPLPQPNLKPSDAFRPKNAQVQNLTRVILKGTKNTPGSQWACLTLCLNKAKREQRLKVPIRFCRLAVAVFAPAATSALIGCVYVCR